MTRAFFAISLAAATGACAAIAGLEPPSPAEGADAGGADVLRGDVPIIDAGVDAAAPDAGADAGDPCRAPGLLAYWRLDEGTGTKAHDCSPGAHDGTITGATWAPGKIGPGALAFTGDAVDFGNPPAFQLTGAMTVSAWVLTNATTTSGRILSKSSQSDRGWELNLETNGTLEFKIARDAFNYVQVARAFPAKQWKHVAGVYEPGAAIRLYVDGAEVAASTSNVPAQQRSSRLNVTMGAMPNETCCRLDGLIDDVRLYGRALGAAEVRALAMP